MTALVCDLVGDYADDASADAAIAAAGWTKSDGIQYYNTTDNCFKQWSVTAAAWLSGAGGGGSNSFPGIESNNVLFVDVDSTAVGSGDGSAQAPYQQISTAYTQAKTMSPDVDNPIDIIVMGGVYENDTVTMDTDYIHIVGQNKDATLFWYSDTSLGDMLVIEATCQFASVSHMSFWCEYAYVGELQYAYAQAIKTADTGSTGETSIISLRDCNFFGPQNYVMDISHSVSWTIEE